MKRKIERKLKQDKAMEHIESLTKSDLTMMTEQKNEWDVFG